MCVLKTLPPKALIFHPASCLQVFSGTTLQNFTRLAHLQCLVGNDRRTAWHQIGAFDLHIVHHFNAPGRSKQGPTHDAALHPTCCWFPRLPGNPSVCKTGALDSSEDRIAKALSPAGMFHATRGSLAFAAGAKHTCKLRRCSVHCIRTSPTRQWQRLKKCGRQLRHNYVNEGDRQESP